MPPDAPFQTADAKLQHMWQAKELLLKQRKRCRHNRRLRIRVARLDQDIQAYATQLVNQQWGQVCESMHGNLSSKRTWQLLRHLPDPSTSRTQHSHYITQLLHKHKDNIPHLFQELARLHLPPTTTHENSDYTGKVNEFLDAPITETEVKHALGYLLLELHLVWVSIM